MARGRSRLLLLRLTAVALCLAGVLLPCAVVLRRRTAAYALSSEAGDDGAVLERFLSEQEGAASSRTARSRKRRSPPAALDAVGTPVLVWLVREQGTRLELHLPASSGEERSVCVGETAAGEATRAAALRALWTCARLAGPPDVEFLLRIGGSAAEAQAVAAGTAASFVALVRQAKLRGASGGAALSFEPLDDVAAQAEAEPTLFSAHFRAALPQVVKTLAPYARTAGRPGGLCAPPAGRAG